MMTADKTITCSDCRQEFVFTASEQQFFADRQFSEPRRCPACRAARKAARNDGANATYTSGYSDSGYATSYRTAPRELFTATCSSCGREAQVPFRPNGSKPVYCNDCFSARRRW